MLNSPLPKIRVAFTKRLLTWFVRHGRDLPWRRERSPYRVWVAEVMLQQTRAETVVPYYERFLARFPNVQALAAAPPAIALTRSSRWGSLAPSPPPRHCWRRRKCLQ